jgi:predicted DNA-binding transcriptional regulator YafY
MPEVRRPSFTDSRAAVQLERILYILPAATRKGGAELRTLADALGVTPERVVSDITEVTHRSFYHPAGSGDDLQIELTPQRVEIWTKGDFRRPAALSLPEAVCLGLALRGRRAEGCRTLLERVEGALSGPSPEELFRQIEASDLRSEPGGIRATVTEALNEGVSCRIRYLKPADDAPVGRTVRPYALAHAEGAWYLLAYCELSEEVRIFRIDRILEAAPTGVPFQVPDDFDGGEYLDGSRVYRGAEETTVRVRYSPRIARWISEREGADPSADGSLTVTHRVADPHWIVRHVLQYGPDAEVLEPEEVRGWVRGVVDGWGETHDLGHEAVGRRT